MSSDLAVSVRGLGKAYPISHAADRSSTLAEAAFARLRRPFSARTREEFWALQNVDLDIRRGEILGVIGRNGAGKSTLLKILSRITYPTAGRVELFGRIGSLLEVGTGFHPELTGRENIFLNGTILGMRHREVARRFDEIVDFAGIEKFLDTPVKRYSSGMYVRLAFAVAAHLDTDILLVDEVLAVGDGAFQRKSLGKMDEAATAGRTVLVVSHNLSVISALASHSVVLDRGALTYQGHTSGAIQHYVTRTTGVTSSGSFAGAQRLDGLSSNPSARIVAGSIDSSVGIYDFGSAPRLRLTIERLIRSADVCLRVTIKRSNSEPVGTTFSGALEWPGTGIADYSVDLDAVSLYPGQYFFVLELRDVRSGHHGRPHDCVQQVLPFEVAPVTTGDSIEEWPYTWGSTCWEPPSVKLISGAGAVVVTDA